MVFVNLDQCTCQEASVLSAEEYVPCGAPATCIVWSSKDRRGYAMCADCGYRNVRRRGMELAYGDIVPAEMRQPVQITPRIPAKLKERLDLEAKRRGVSLNQLYNDLLEAPFYSQRSES